MHGGWKGLLFRSRHFFLTVSVVVPVGITLIDEVGLPGNVKGVSMRPSFNPAHEVERGKKKKKWWENDVVWVSRWNVRSASSTLKPGDVVAFHSPVDPDTVVIKRVVATPGDKLRTRNDGTTVTIPRCYYWIEGDNARIGASEDSNLYGPVSEGLVLGQVTRILWPPQRWQTVGHKLTSEQSYRIIPPCRYS